MKDVPATTTERAKPAPEKKAPQPAPKPATPVVPKTLTAAAGTRVPLAASESISTRQAKPGDAFSATVGEDVKDASGRVVIPAGSTVQGPVVAAEPAPNPSSSGRLELAVHSITVRGASYPVDATVESKDTVMQGRGVTKADAAKVGGGAVAGAIVGKLLGKNAKGAIIGAGRRAPPRGAAARAPPGHRGGAPQSGPPPHPPAEAPAGEGGPRFGGGGGAPPPRGTQTPP